MTEETGVWLSTSRPPKQTSSKRHKSVLKFKPCIKPTTFFSATLTQNSPPPPQLFTSRKQSYLTDYFRKGCENDIHCVNTSEQTTNVIDTGANGSLDSMQFNQQPITEGCTEHEMVASSESLDKGNDKRTSTKSFDDHKDKLQTHCTDVTYMSSDDNIKDSIQNEDFDLFENPAKVLKFEHDVNTYRLNVNTSVLEDVTNSPRVKANLASITVTDCGFGSGSSSLSFTQTHTSLGFNSKNDSYFNGADFNFNKDFFHAMKQKHYKDMDTLHFTEDSTR